MHELITGADHEQLRITALGVPGGEPGKPVVSVDDVDATGTRLHRDATAALDEGQAEDLGVRVRRAREDDRVEHDA